MDVGFKLTTVSTCPDSSLNIIFIHGLKGNSVDTWSNGKTDGYWPEWIQSDIPNVNVYSLNYPTDISYFFKDSPMDIFERANAVLDYFSSIGLGDNPIILITHSLGGLLAKIILRAASESNDEDYSKISKAIKLCIFIATPHTGSSLANVLTVTSLGSNAVNLLANNTGYLSDLKQFYRDHTSSRNDLSTATYYETLTTKRILVVNRESADPGVSGPRPVAIDKNHVDICKPEDSDDVVYRSIIHKIKRLYDDNEKSQSALSLPPAYNSRSTNDRRELLQKLIDANREHEYNYVNESQNTFARNFSKLGLSTTAWETYERLLSEVETRFVTHVYHPLICLSAADDIVTEKIQSHILDPVSAIKFSNYQFSSKQILGALHFLTEQCHIRWDKDV